MDRRIDSRVGGPKSKSADLNKLAYLRLSLRGRIVSHGGLGRSFSWEADRRSRKAETKSMLVCQRQLSGRPGTVEDSGSRFVLGVHQRTLKKNSIIEKIRRM